uniref:Ig-like domain-containing protein n=1 Tax=Poecilia formosa TaxID=48698 RepID=A0A087XHI8_POEFO
VSSVSQHALGGVVEVNEGAESVLLPCIYSDIQPEDPFLIWTRSDLSPNSVHLRRENGDDLKNQNQRFRNRTSMNPDALDTGNFSLTLRKPEQDDGGNYSCSISDGIKELNLKQIHLKVKELFPSWASALLVLLVLVLIVSAGVFYHFKDYFLKEQLPWVKVDSGVKFVLLPCRTKVCLPGGARVEWRDGENRTVHVYRNGSDDPEEQNLTYSNRTRMNDDPLKTKDLSLTLESPSVTDSGIYTCRVGNRVILMMKRVHLQVKAPLVKVDSGVKSVLLPCKTKLYLPGGARVEWRDGENRTVHVYPNGSDDPEEQNLTNSKRTRMNDDPLKTGDLSLTLEHPRFADSGIYTCRVSIWKRVILMKQVHLQVKGQWYKC